MTNPTKRLGLGWHVGMPHPREHPCVRSHATFSDLQFSSSSIVYQPCLIFGQLGVDQSISVLSERSSMNSDDEWFIYLIRLQQLIEDVMNVFPSTLSSNASTYDATNVRFKLDMFRKRLSTLNSNHTFSGDARKITIVGFHPLEPPRLTTNRTTKICHAFW